MQQLTTIRYMNEMKHMLCIELLFVLSSYLFCEENDSYIRGFGELASYETPYFFKYIRVRRIKGRLGLLFESSKLILKN